MKRILNQFFQANKKALLKVTFFSLFILGAVFNSAHAAESASAVERYAVYVASNNGGSSREVLRYAGTDAIKLAVTMTEIGGIEDKNSYILVDPRKNELDDILDAVSHQIEADKKQAKRTEFIFYYSGHSDENALLLGDETYDYSDLKASITSVPSDIHVVMLDSCFSGNFIRAKGGSRQKSFLQDDSSIVQGHAYLSSSSETESSQESDVLRASYFTHAMVNGLRGAADASGDNKVSLNELYSYAFSETLSKTERSVIGPQHPSYNITLVGSGDLVLTDVSASESLLVIPSESEGKYFIRTLDGVLVSELNKIPGNKVALALPEGYYAVTIVVPGKTDQANIRIVRGQEYILSDAQFKRLAQTPGRARGDVSSDNNSGGASVNVTVSPVITVNSGAVDAAAAAGTAAVSGAAAAAEKARNAADAAFAANGFITSSAEVIAAREALNAAAAAGMSRQVLDELTDNLAEAIKRDALDRARQIRETSSVTAAAPSGRNADDYLRYGPADQDFSLLFPRDNVKWEPFVISVLPSVSVPSPVPPYVNLSLGLFIAEDEHIDGIQASSFIGTVNKTIDGLQAAGFIAKIGRAMDGVQLSGAFATIEGPAEGAQVSGFAATILGRFKGAQVSGFCSTAKTSFEGAQVAGFCNTVFGDFEGSQVAGFCNTAKGVFEGAQVAGFSNYSKGMFQGSQVSGFVNTAPKGYEGAQVSGFINYSRGVAKGAQVSGFLNAAETFSGVQVGVVNIAKSSNGIAIGLLNFIGDGLFSPSVYQDSDERTFFQFQSGTRKLFSSLFVGGRLNTNPDAAEDTDVRYIDEELLAGYAFGTRLTFTRSLSLDIEVTFKHLFNAQFKEEMETLFDVDWDKLVEDAIAGNADAQFEIDEETFDEKAFNETYFAYMVPGIRLTANYSLFQHLSFFASVAAEFNFGGVSTTAFDTLGYSNEYTFESLDTDVHTTFSFGIRL